MEEDGQILEEDYGIPRYLRTIMSPWRSNGCRNLVATLPSSAWSNGYPSRLNQIALSKTEPGDENNQDISSLVGKVDIRQAGRFPAA
ncbi:MAG: hypothetical protein R3E95_21890 [Thiolinea sp.]